MTNLGSRAESQWIVATKATLPFTIPRSRPVVCKGFTPSRARFAIHGPRHATTSGGGLLPQFYGLEDAPRRAAPLHVLT